MNIKQKIKVIENKLSKTRDGLVRNKLWKQLIQLRIKEHPLAWLHCPTLQEARANGEVKF